MRKPKKRVWIVAGIVAGFGLVMGIWRLLRGR